VFQICNSFFFLLSDPDPVHNLNAGPGQSTNYQSNADPCGSGSRSKPFNNQVLGYFDIFLPNSTGGATCLYLLKNTEKLRKFV
jgi:hypothetical protein